MHYRLCLVVIKTLVSQWSEVNVKGKLEVIAMSVVLCLSREEKTYQSQMKNKSTLLYFYDYNNELF